MGGEAAFIDAEHALDPIYAKKLGVYIERLIVSQPDNGEEELEITDYKGFGDLQLAWCYALIDEKEKAKEYFENVDKYLVSSLEKDKELKKDYNIVKELINSNIYFN